MTNIKLRPAVHALQLVLHAGCLTVHQLGPDNSSRQLGNNADVIVRFAATVSNIIRDCIACTERDLCRKGQTKLGERSVW